MDEEYDSDSYNYGHRRATFVPDKNSELRYYWVSMCKWIKEGKECRNKNGCTYAHSKNEQRRPYDPIYLDQRDDLIQLYQYIKNR